MSCTGQRKRKVKLTHFRKAYKVLPKKTEITGKLKYYQMKFILSGGPSSWEAEEAMNKQQNRIVVKNKTSKHQNSPTGRLVLHSCYRNLTSVHNSP